MERIGPVPTHELFVALGLVVAVAVFLVESRRRGQTDLTLPQVRAVIQEVLTAHFFMTQPHYLKWMLTLKEVEMRK